MKTTLAEAVSNPSSSRGRIRLAAVVGLAGFVSGIATSYGQSLLPEEIGSLANSAGAWCLVAVALALLATGQLSAAASGALALAALLAGYVVASSWRSFPSSTGLLVFWGLSAIVVGPFLGLAASWIKTDRPIFNALGAGGITGLLVGEGVYGLRYISDSTYPPYWWAQIACGAALLIWAVARRIRRARLIALAVGINLLIAALFVALYRLNLIALFP